MNFISYIQYALNKKYKDNCNIPLTGNLNLKHWWGGGQKYTPEIVHRFSPNLFPHLSNTFAVPSHSTTGSNISRGGGFLQRFNGRIQFLTSHIEKTPAGILE